MLRFLFVLCFFNGTRSKTQKIYECDGLGLQGTLGNTAIPYEMFVSATQVKNCDRRCIFSGQSAIFQGEGKTRRNITILTMFKNINVHKNKTTNM